MGTMCGCMRGSRRSRRTSGLRIRKGRPRLRLESVDSNRAQILRSAASSHACGAFDMNMVKSRLAALRSGRYIYKCGLLVGLPLEARESFKQAASATWNPSTAAWACRASSKSIRNSVFVSVEHLRFHEAHRDLIYANAIFRRHGLSLTR